MSAPSPPAAAPVNLGAQLFSSFGVAFIGLNIALVLYGVTCIQVFQYFRHQYKDTLYIPILVGSLWILDTLHQVFFSHVVYHYLITEYGNPSALFTLVWSFPSALLISGLITTLVDTFFLWRLWKLSNNKMYLIIIVFFEIGHISMYLMSAIQSFINKDVTTALAASKNVGIAAIAVDSVIGLMLSAGLIHHLNGSRTGYTKSEDIISRLVRVTVSTGSLTTSVLILELIAYVVAPTHFYVAILNFLVAKLYINSFLTFLNIREGLKSRGDGQSNSLPISSWRAESTSRNHILVEKSVEVQSVASNHGQTNVTNDADLPTLQPAYLNTV